MNLLTKETQHHWAAVAPLLFVAIWRTTFEAFDDAPFEAQEFVDQHIETFLRGIALGAKP